VSWQAPSFALLALALAAGFLWYECDKPPSRVLALVAALAALAVIGRLAFAAIPNVKPTTDIVLFAGYALGAAPGFAVGAVTAIVSNVFLSQGPWTVWQMAGWGAVGVAGALLARVLRGREPGRVVLAAVCGLAGLAFGVWMDVYQWTLAARQDVDSYVVVAGTSLPYNLAHAIGNVAFCLLIGPAFVRALARYRRRLEVRWPAPAGVAAGTLLALALLMPSPAGAASAAERAERYLLRAQNLDGGFGAATRQRSAPLYTGWAGLGLAAAGRNPRDVARRGGRSVIASLRGGRGLDDIGEVERTVLLLRAAGVDPRRFGGRDLIAEIERRRRPDGSISGFVSYTAFGVLALRAAGEPVGGGALGWLRGSQNADGGFGVAPSSGSDSDMTGAVLQALAATGRRRGHAARRAAAWLARAQNADGGFSLTPGRASNAQSTAYAVQGLVAVRARSAAVRRALRYLARLVRRDGSVAYSSVSTQTPVWVTAQALMALHRAPLPLRPVARAVAGSNAADEGSDGGGGAAAPPAGGGYERERDGRSSGADGRGAGEVPRSEAADSEDAPGADAPIAPLPERATGETGSPLEDVAGADRRGTSLPGRIGDGAFPAAAVAGIAAALAALAAAWWRRRGRPRARGTPPAA